MILRQKKYTLFNLIPTLISMSPAAMTAAFLANLSIGLIPVVSALSTAWFVDSAIRLATGGIALSGMIMPLVCAFLVQALDFCRWNIDQFSMNVVGIHLLRELRPTMARKAASLQYRLIEDAGTWDLIHRMTDEPNKKLYRILDGMIYLGQLTVGLFGVLALIASQVPWAALAVGACFVPTIWISLKLGGKSYEEKAKIEREKRRFEALRRMCTQREYTEERATFGYGEETARRFEAEFEPAYKSYFRYWRLRLTTAGAMQSAFVVLMVATACILAVPAIQGALTVGTLVAIVREVLAMSERMGGLSYCMTQLGEGRAFVKDMTDFAALPETDGALDGADPEPIPFESLEFSHVSFTYPGTEREVLSDLSLRLEKGKHYAFVGVNGAGKTTMTKLICGLYTEFEGEILLNGKDIRSYTQGQLKALIAPIFQDFARYQVPLRDSIALGNPAAEAKLSEVIGAAGLSQAVAALKDGMDTPLGKIYEGGQDLSGGEWQRVAIARALARRAPLCILDEPTAALDPMSESRFYTQFGELTRGRTTIFISHRLGSTALSDRIFVLEGGRIAEEGTQKELLEREGLFAQMYEAQRSWYQ